MPAHPCAGLWELSTGHPIDRRAKLLAHSIDRAE